MSPLLQIPEPGEVIAGKYRLTSVLGRGGMGVVFEGHHELLDRKVAIKVLAPEVIGNQEAVTRFMNEARAAAKISSERVVQVLDVGLLDGGLPFMVMERLEGVDLSDLLEQRELGVTEVVDLLLEAIEGVGHAHLVGIIHRDLKPANLFLARRPDHTVTVKVLDFGISKLTGPQSHGDSVTATNAILGSPHYMSPEQLRSSKSIDVRADIWSLGVIAYELLTRQRPFVADNLIEMFLAIQDKDPRSILELRPEIPPGLAAVVHKCLARAPDDRFPTVFALARALRPFGDSRAATSLARMDALLAAHGVSIEEEAHSAEVRLPASGFANTVDTSPHAERPSATQPGPTPVPAPVHAMTPPPVAASGESTSAPWASGASEALVSRPSPKRWGWGVVGALAIVAAGWAFASSTRTSAAPVNAGMAPPSATAAPAAPATETTPPLPPPTASAEPSALPPTTTASALPPSKAPAAASPSPKAATAPPPAHVTPKAPAPKASASPPKNPLLMNTY